VPDDQLNPKSLAPALAISLDGDVIDVPPDLALRLIRDDEVIGREWRRHRARFGARGRVILIQPDAVARVAGLLHPFE
jgi:hypothetical protein